MEVQARSWKKLRTKLATMEMWLRSGTQLDTISPPIIRYKNLLCESQASNAWCSRTRALSTRALTKECPKASLTKTWRRDLIAYRAKSALQQISSSQQRRDSQISISNKTAHRSTVMFALRTKKLADLCLCLRQNFAIKINKKEPLQWNRTLHSYSSTRQGFYMGTIIMRITALSGNA